MAAYTPQLVRLIISLGRKFPALWDDILKKPSNQYYQAVRPFVLTVGQPF